MSILEIRSAVKVKVTRKCDSYLKLDDMKRSCYLLYNVEKGQGQLQLIMKHILF